MLCVTLICVPQIFHIENILGLLSPLFYVGCIICEPHLCTPNIPYTEWDSLADTTIIFYRIFYLSPWSVYPIFYTNNVIPLLSPLLFWIGCAILCLMCTSNIPFTEFDSFAKPFIIVYIGCTSCHPDLGTPKHFNPIWSYIGYTSCNTHLVPQIVHTGDMFPLV